MKGEPQWMRDIRLKALDVFWQKPTPTWGGDLSHLDFNDIHYLMGSEGIGSHPARRQKTGPTQRGV